MVPAHTLPPAPPAGPAAAPDLPDLAAAAAWAPSLAQAFVGLACDLALVLDARGRVLSVAQGSAGALADALRQAVGAPWADAVTPESRPKIASLLADVAQSGVAPRREITLQGEPPIPVACAAMRLGPQGPTLAVGHDLRAVARLQQRFLLTQRDLEQGYQQALDTLAAPRAPPQAARAMAQLLPTAAELLGVEVPEPASRPLVRAPAKARAPRRGKPRRR